MNYEKVLLFEIPGFIHKLPIFVASPITPPPLLFCLNVFLLAIAVHFLILELRPRRRGRHDFHPLVGVWGIRSVRIPPDLPLDCLFHTFFLASII